MGLTATIKAPAVISGSTTTGEQAKVTRMVVPGIKGADGDITTSPTFTSFDNTADAPKWASCFGTNNPDALVPQISENVNAYINSAEDPSSNYFSQGTMTPGRGAEEFLD